MKCTWEWELFDGLDKAHLPLSSLIFITRNLHTRKTAEQRM